MDDAVAVHAGVLGPTSLLVGSRAADLGPVRPRLVLAKLVLNAGQVVRTEQLADVVWPHERPSSWGVQLQSAVMAIRKAVSAAGCRDVRSVVRTGGGGYRLDLDPNRTDLGRFRIAVVSATHLVRSGDEPAALRRLREAEAQWRGPALADVRAHGMEAEAQRLDDQLLSVREQRLSLELQCDYAADSMTELVELTGQHPWRERLHELLLTALWRQGRAASALTHYRALRERYVDELGIEPGIRLVTLQQKILDQARHAPPSAGGKPPPLTRPYPPRPVVPHQLPPAIRHLVGRDELIRAAAAVLCGDPTVGSPAVVALHGPAGIGKTATTAAIAHLVASHFSDGQIFVQLRDSTGRPTGPREAMAWVLRSLHGPDTDIPTTVSECAAHLRTSTFDRRILMWLEDATDLSVVRQLLPASPTCGVLITSRLPLVGLEQATHLPVPPLTEQDSRELLEALLGRTAAPDEQDELRSVILHCAGLPLALRIVGSRLAVGGPTTLKLAARTLSDGARQLDWLVADDLDLRSTLRFALSDADEAARRLFGLLAVTGSRQLPTWVAAALLDTAEDTAEQAAHQLVQLGLLEACPAHPHCFRVHSLVLAFANEALLDTTGEDETRSARRRALRAALHLTSAADERIPHGASLSTGVAVPEVVPTPTALAAVESDPLRWLDHNLPVLVAVGATRADPELRAALVVRLNGYLAIRDAFEVRSHLLGSIGDIDHIPAELASRLWQCRFSASAQHGENPGVLRQMARDALEAATTAGSDALTVGALVQLGFAAYRDCAMAEAEQSYRHALTLIDSNRGLRSRASVLCGLANVLRDDGRVDDALELFVEAATDSTRAGSRIQAIVLVDLATALLDVRDCDQAEARLQDAMQIIDEIGDELGSAHAAVVTARIHGLRAEWPQAQRRLTFAAEVGQRHRNAELLRLVVQARADIAYRQGDHIDAEALLAGCVRDAWLAGDKLTVLHVRRLRRTLGLPAAGASGTTGGPGRTTRA